MTQGCFVVLPRYARMAGLECETEPSKERAMFRTVLNPGDNAVPRIGTVMPDGTIYAGSTTPAKDIYAAPTDAPLAMTFNEAADYAAKRNREIYLGHNDWRVPTEAELNVLFNNHATIGGFNASGSDPSSYYWTSSRMSSSAEVLASEGYLQFEEQPPSALCQKFSNGYVIDGPLIGSASVRLVRSEVRKP